MWKFSIRDLLLFTLVMALGIGWWAHQRELKNEHRQLQLENELFRDELLELRFPVARLQPRKVEEVLRQAGEAGRVPRDHLDEVT